MIKKKLNFDKLIVENSIRKYTVRQTISLDLCKDVLFENQNNRFFYGTENKNRLKICRIKNPLNFIFPKLIFSFEKDNFQCFSVRLGILSMLLYLPIVFICISAIVINLIDGNFNFDIILFLSMLALIFFLTIFEYKLTYNKINKAVGFENEINQIGFV